MTIRLPDGPSPETIHQFIVTTYPETDVVSIPGGTFYSLDPEQHFPNYATLVTNDEFDQASELFREGVFRLNLGVDKATFERLVGDMTEPDHTALDVVLPHPVYAAQRYVSILNPSAATWRDVVIPLIAVAHDRLAAQRARHGQGPASATPWDAEEAEG